MWAIDKTFEFCYGHRVWSQVLNAEYADNLLCACRHLHGHEAKVQVFLESSQLNDTGMVTDFRHLEWLKRWLNEFVDHHFIIDRNDPLYDRLVGKDARLDTVSIPGTDLIAGRILSLSDLTECTPEYELFEGFFIVDFVPTSENLSSWIAKLVAEKMKPLNVNVHHVEWWETPKSRSSFYPV